MADAPSAFGVELPAVQEWTVGPHDLGAVEAPTLSVVNNEDRWVGFQEMHQAVVSGVPDAAEVQVDVPTHLLQIANPEPVAAAVAHFLARSPRR